MLYYLFAILADVCIALTFSLNKLYRDASRPNIYSIASKLALSSAITFLLFFIVGGLKLRINGFVVLMSVVMTLIAFLSETVCFTAYGKGQMSLFTVFQMQGGMLLPFVYGILYGNKVNWATILGICLMIFALFLTVRKDDADAAEKKPVSKAFILLCIAIFFVNGSISIASYIYSNGAQNLGAENFLMTKSLMLLLAAGAVCLLFRKQAPQKGFALKPMLFVAGSTILDSVGYYLQLIGAANLPAVVLYPVVTGGTVLLTAVAGRLFFKEQHNKMQLLGFAITFLATLLFLVP